MGKPTGFQEYKRELPSKVDPLTRVKNYKEFYLEFSEEKIQCQAARCMDCGVPFCHSGCPLGNIIPEFNDAVYDQQWEQAYKILSSTNNFPEFTGRICPAPCEASCVLGINNDPVTIENIEKSIIEKAYQKGLVKAKIPTVRTDQHVAIIGSGPAGLAAAYQLNQAGHNVTVFERDDRAGGLLRYGIPDFKLEKWVIDRRLNIMEEEGIQFVMNTEIGSDLSVEEVFSKFDSVILCGGSTVPNDLQVKGRELTGVHFAMDYLKQSNKLVAGDALQEELISSEGKHVIVIGGGDTGSDCVGTSNRQGARSITQLELLPKPPEKRDASTPWPMWPKQLRTSTSHEEGCDRLFSVLTKEFIGDENGNVKEIKIVDVEWKSDLSGKMSFQEVEGTERILPCDKAYLSIGFAHPQKSGLLEELGVHLDERGNVKTQGYKTNISNVFAAGDMRRGQSLVVWAISEGREAARVCDEYLQGESVLARKDASYVVV
ncbi:glutamate synthase subunit beta [Aureibacter tunicatorum]|uniref:Glutamate synthase (NADPH/NADH) small chain n=1 Tax=Aureibacter tunicatorum TaxID=866807 RepID=A0AAE3XPI6_9BACT|nr:glutamate synthase subunit beta [Aureibacter tunicatorum]MDR6239669.1 glutamate synthase (NADPH/NADH) small chain [Aureibacter tunicatorum]BDD04145.1 dihydropyrimidine dehydrogenase subunit A [Aureibacter tunicatorum]